MPESSVKRSNFLLDNTPSQSAGNAMQPANMSAPGIQPQSAPGQNAAATGTVQSEF